MLWRETLKYLPAVLVTVGIAILSLTESSYVPRTLSAQDKLLHGAMYMLLAVCWMVPVAKSFPSRFMPYLLVWSGVTAYGALMEILQRFCTLTRSGEMADLYADMIGALVGILLVPVILKIANRKP